MTDQEKMLNAISSIALNGTKEKGKEGNET